MRKLHTQSSLRQQVLRIISSPPRPERDYDVGYDTGSLTFIFRSVCGALTHEHPSLVRSRQVAHVTDSSAPSAVGSVDSSIPAYTSDGSICAAQWPPSDSTFVLVPEASGAWCYYDTALGTAQWSAPPGSSPLTHRLLAAHDLGNSLPPALDCRIALNSLHGTHWMPVYEDSSHEVLLYHQDCSAVREGPWIALRTLHGVVYFANLVTHQTRWIPPMRWMADWVSRGYTVHTGATGHHMIRTDDFADHPSARYALPPAVSRRRVEGGAPYLHEHDLHGTPQYSTDMLDTPLTHPEAQPDLTTPTDLQSAIFSVSRARSSPLDSPSHLHGRLRAAG